MNHSLIPQQIPITEDLRLELLAPNHAAPLVQLVDNNRGILSKWLPWVNRMQTESDFLHYINRCEEQMKTGTDVSYAIIVNYQVAGRIGLHYIDQQNKTASIGYWLGKDFFSRGVVTKACKALLGLAFGDLQMNRIEIKCATTNEKSAAVAERLGFRKEGVLRQAEWVNGHRFDLALYSLLKEEHKP